MDRIIQLTTNTPISVLLKIGIMAWNNRTACIDNCSGHGECQNGTCICEIQYEGDECHSPNMSYHIAFASIFFFLALVCTIQLVMCIVSEFQRMKAPSFLKACRITTQKLLYFVMLLATLIRGAYFTSPEDFREGWTRSLMSAFYPLLLSGSSLIVCFWAEVFHLRDLRCERPQFLSKSFLGFVIFNIITYSLLLAELIATTHFAPKTTDDRNFFTHIFNGCYAVLLFIVVIFFLIYGVEVFFKVRGGFLSEQEDINAILARNRRPRKQIDITQPSTSKEAQEATNSLLRGAFIEGLPRKVDRSQLNQSRVGLVSQAILLFFIVGFLFSETLSEFWKQKVPVVSRNLHDIVFHVCEIGVVLWFPCVLWNCMKPEQLWILNPKKLFKKLELPISPTGERDLSVASDSDEESADPNCYICWDTSKTDAGPLIKPCLCRGDVGTVHHDCLRLWLIELSARLPRGESDKEEEVWRCNVCNSPYQVEKGSRLDWNQGFTVQHWLRTVVIVTLMCVFGFGAWVVIQLNTNTCVRLVALGVAGLVIYVGIKFLGLNTVNAYQRAKVSALNIRGQSPLPSTPSSSSSSNSSLLTSITPPLTTISETVSVDIQSTEIPSKKKDKQQTQI